MISQYIVAPTQPFILLLLHENVARIAENFAEKGEENGCCETKRLTIHKPQCHEQLLFLIIRMNQVE